MSKLKTTFLTTAACLLSVALLLSCNKEDEAPFGNGTGIRIENLSTYTFDEVLVETGGGGEQEYLDIPVGGITDYKPFEYTYRYAYIRTIIGGDTLTLQPIDFVGEQQFTKGAFTFRIDIVGETTPLYMVFEFKED
ncbi:MAG: hypothetical protein KDC75_12810 [Phaeodactylibacter sp.]|nr:hypothetical protein [Phaeodactylibacter sp.]